MNYYLVGAFSPQLLFKINHKHLFYKDKDLSKFEMFALSMV